MKYALPILFAFLLAPAVVSAGDRWERSSRSDRGYRYDRGERYSDRGHSRSRSSFGLSFGFGSSGHRDNNYGSFSYGYNSGYNRGGYYRGDDGYVSRPPVVYRDTYVYSAPRHYSTSRYYDCPPPVTYCPPAPRVYYYDGGAGANYSGSVYYYRR